MGKLRVVHISDLHLFVEPDGAARKLTEIYGIVAWANRHPGLPLVGGFSVHDGQALTALREAITDLIENSPTPVLVIQSGDVSTFGARMRNGAGISFPEWEFWNTERTRPRAKQPIGWIDLYGNHDIWPGTLPAAAPHKVEAARDELRLRHHTRQIPERMPFAIGQHLVEVYTLNTVQHHAVANTFAEGEFDFDHPDRTKPRNYPDTSTSDPLDHITALARRHRPADPHVQVLRLLVMHHPPVFFGISPTPGISGAWKKLTSGTLRNEATLLRWLHAQDAQDIPQHLVLAGHRHLIDPLPGKAPSPLGSSQCIQLVCGTPTQSRGRHDPPHSFSVYDVNFDPQLAVTRTIYERPALARDFRPAGGAVPIL